MVFKYHAFFIYTQDQKGYPLKTLFFQVPGEGMIVTIYDFLKYLDAVIPFSLAESWDNCGLQAGRPDAAVTRVMVALDVTMEVMNAAVEWGADLVLTHHPLMISSLKQVDFSTMPGAAIALSAKHDISIISLHTNLDKARGGLNDRFAQLLGLQQINCLHSCCAAGVADQPPPLPGIGRMGELSVPVTLTELGKQVKRIFNAGYIRMIGDPYMMVKTVAVCTGSGESLLKEVFNTGAHAYITGDIKYHGARDIETSGMGCIDVGHFASEHIAIDLLVEKVKAISVQDDLGFDVKGYSEASDPFVYI